MSLSVTKKSPIAAIPFLKKRLRRITALGLRNLTVTDFNFTVHFTLHRYHQTIAFYTSQPIENQRSPEWSHLEYPSSVQCLQNFLMRLWITSSNMCRLFLEYEIHLDDSLLPDEQKDDSTRLNNSLWLEMFGYRFTDNESTTDKTNLSISTEPTVNPPEIRLNKKVVQSPKTYNQLSIRRMITAIQVIEKQRQTAASFLERLQTFFDHHQNYLSNVKEREIRQTRIKTLKEYLKSLNSLNQQRSRSHEEQKESLENRKIELEENLSKLLEQRDKWNTDIEQLKQAKSTLNDLLPLINYRQKELLTEVYRYIYPIVIDQNKDVFIGNLKLPSAEDKIYQNSLNRERSNEITAAIGFCAHFVLLISQFLHLPLRFPIEYDGTSTMKIYDYSVQISEVSLECSSKNQTFSYAFFLLNRDIGQLMQHCRVNSHQTDYRKTLENLKELMEKHFLPTRTHRNQISRLEVNPHSMGIPIPIRSKTSSEGNSSYRSKRNLTLTPVFSSLHSSTSSLLETNDFDQTVDNSQDLELFSLNNTISPRLAMQYSMQPK